MPVPDRERSDHMALRVARSAVRAGLKSTSLLDAAHRVAMGPRHARLDDDHDPRYLHPGRSFLVVLEDGGVRDPSLLATAILLETVDPSLSPYTAEVEAEASGELTLAWERALGLPRPWDDDLAERLVTAGEAERALVLGEWLDQLRHLRQVADPRVVARAAARTAEVYLPVAERQGGTLARRYRWWVRRVGPGLTASS